MASEFGCGSDSNRVSVLFPVAYGWIKGICRGVGLGAFAGAGVAMADPAMAYGHVYVLHHFWCLIPRSVALCT